MEIYPPAVYLGSISYSDYLFGRLMTVLQNVGYWNDTAVFMFSDHGDYGGTTRPT
jgi:choline-sulfatase